MNRLRVRKIVALGLLAAALSGMTACRSDSAAQSRAPIATPPARSAQRPTPHLPAAQPGDQTGTIVVQGQSRTYVLHTPQQYRRDRRFPLVLAFHGYGSQGKDLAASSGLNQVADQQGFLVAYPDGLERRWNVASGFIGVDDLAFTTALIDHLQTRRAIDPARIYATGVSNGGFWVQRLACDMSDRIAAFASVAATLPGQLKVLCHPPAPVPILMMNGTDDRKVPWQGGELPYGSILSVPATIEFWRQQNGCSTPAASQALNSRVQIDRYTACRAGAEVELVTLKGAGHVFPRGGTGANQLLNGSQEIWQFLQRHRLEER